MKYFTVFLICLLLYSCNRNQQLIDTIHPQLLTCELIENPIGIDLSKPRFGWKLISKQRNELQTAYTILVASNKELLEHDEADFWNSGKVTSGQSVWVTYKGKPLQSSSTYYWKVKVWDKEGNVSVWSKISFFTTSIIAPNQLQARWIGIDSPLGTDILQSKGDNSERPTQAAARYLRKDIRLSKNIKSAFAYICGLGAYEFYINGARVGDYVLAPNASEYSKIAYYNTYDVTTLLKQGRNALGVILGNGRWLPPRYSSLQDTAMFGWPKLILQINVEFDDGSTQTITTNDSWRITADGPITANNEFDGEKYDACKELPGWNLPAYDDSKWLKAELVNAPSTNLIAQLNEPIRVVAVVKPISIKPTKNQSYIIDFGQNMQGWIKIKATGKRGNQITIKYAETLKVDGGLYTENLRTAKATDSYVLKGEGTEIYEPRFTLHGFRFVEIVGYTGILKLSDLEACVVHDDIATTGSFECSDTTINKIYSNVVWGTRTNYRSFPTDCPQRDERMGWLGDRAGGSLGEAYMFDVSKLYSKWFDDMRVSQRDSGSLSDVIPTYWQVYNDNITWEGAYILCLENMFAMYADSALVKKHYPSTRKWVLHMQQYLKNGIISRDTYGDWCMPPERADLIHSLDPKRITGAEILATSYFYKIHKVMQQFALIANCASDTALYAQKANEMLLAFNKQLFDVSEGYYGNNSATSNLLPLAFNMVPNKYKQTVFDQVVYKLMGEFGGNVCTGLIGQQRIMRVLSDFGRPDLAYKLATNTTYPSWGYMLNNGATTIWELWNGNTANPAMNSGNHVMLVGDLAIWLYQYVGGIRYNNNSPGFKEFNLQPLIVGNLTYAKATYNSLYGLISSSWNVTADTFYWKVSIPVNTQASIMIPASNANKVFEGNKPATEAEGLTYIGYNNGYATFKAGSGNYSFKSSGFTRHSEKEFVKAPSIEPSDTLLFAPDSVKVSITSAPENDIFYTTNGNIPTLVNSKYEQPFYVNKYTIIKAIAISKHKIQSYVSTTIVDVANKKLNGLNYTYYEGTWLQLPDFKSLKPKYKGKTSVLTTKIKKRADYFGIVFSGFISIPIDGNYTFNLTSDDGSLLRINNQLIVENNGIHGLNTKSTSVELKQGKYPIEIQYFDGNYGDELSALVRGPGINMQPMPLSWLSYE